MQNVPASTAFRGSQYLSITLSLYMYNQTHKHLNTNTHSSEVRLFVSMFNPVSLKGVHT